MPPEAPQPNPTPRPPRPGGNKRSQAELKRRVMEVFKLRLAGAEFHDISQFAAAPEQNWGVSERTIWAYIRRADALSTRYFDAKAGHLLGRHLMMRRQLFAHALGAGDYSTALRVLDSEAKLENLFDQDLIRRIEALEAAAAAVSTPKRRK